MVKIEQIIEQNKWWGQGKGFENFDPDLKKYHAAFLKIQRKRLVLEKGKVTIIYGPRQAGKTTFLKKTIKELIIESGVNPESIAYFSCDALTSNSPVELRKVIIYLLDKIKMGTPAYVFIDEISGVRDWSKEIKFIIDKGGVDTVSFCITGSPFGIKERLPGRPTKEYYLKPLTFRDFVENICQSDLDHSSRKALRIDDSQHQELKQLKEDLKRDNLLFNFTSLSELKEKIKKIDKYYSVLQQIFKVYLRTGGFPSIINHYVGYMRATIEQRDVEKRKEAFENEYNMIINQLIDTLRKQGKNEVIAKQILYNITEKLPSRYSFDALKTEDSVSKSTIIEYVRHLEEIFLVKILYAYDFSKKSVGWKKQKKIYFSDPFIYYAFKKFLTGKEGVDITESLLANEESTGALIENISALSLIQTKEEPFIKSADTFVWFWYDERNEIDFIYANEDYFGIEIKIRGMVDTPRLPSISHIKKYCVITKEDLDFRENILCIPAHLFLFLIKKGEFHL